MVKFLSFDKSVTWQSSSFSCKQQFKILSSGQRISMRWRQSSMALWPRIWEKTISFVNFGFTFNVVLFEITGKSALDVIFHIFIYVMNSTRSHLRNRIVVLMLQIIQFLQNHIRNFDVPIWLWNKNKTVNKSKLDSTDWNSAWEMYLSRWYLWRKPTSWEKCLCRVRQTLCQSDPLWGWVWH